MTISIHALLAESDISCAWSASKLADFYPRSPCGERPDTLTDDVSTGGFLSTLSLRRATLLLVLLICPPPDFYPRSPCGERPEAKRTTDIRPPFLSTLSLRRATNSSVNTADQEANFYPRSPCGERRLLCYTIHPLLYFYPRSPCGERLMMV